MAWPVRGVLLLKLGIRQSSEIGLSVSAQVLLDTESGTSVKDFIVVGAEFDA